MNIEQVCWLNEESGEFAPRNWLTGGPCLAHKCLEVLVDRCFDPLRVKCFDLSECSCFVSCNAHKEVSGSFVELVIIHHAVLTCKWLRKPIEEDFCCYACSQFKAVVASKCL